MTNAWVSAEAIQVLETDNVSQARSSAEVVQALELLTANPESMPVLTTVEGGSGSLPAKMWDGQNWVSGQFKVWQNGTWKTALAKVWDGVEWVGGSGQVMTAGPRFSGKESNGTTSTLNYPTGLTVGSTILLGVSCEGGINSLPITIPGFTRIGSNHALTSYWTTLYTRKIDGTEADFATSGWPSNIAWCMAEFLDVDAVHTSVHPVAPGNHFYSLVQLPGIPSDRAWTSIYVSGGQGDNYDYHYPQMQPAFHTKCAESIRWRPGVSIGYLNRLPGQQLSADRPFRSGAFRTSTPNGLQVALIGKANSTYSELTYDGARKPIVYVASAGYNSSTGTTTIAGALSTDFILQGIAINGDVGYGHQHGLASGPISSSWPRRLLSFYGTLQKNTADDMRDGVGWHAGGWRQYRDVDTNDPFRDVQQYEGTGRTVSFPTVNVKAGDVVVTMTSHTVNAGINASAVQTGYTDIANANQWPTAFFSAHKYITADGTEAPPNLDIGVNTTAAYRSIVYVLKGAPV